MISWCPWGAGCSKPVQPEHSSTLAQTWEDFQRSGRHLKILTTFRKLACFKHFPVLDSGCVFQTAILLPRKYFFFKNQRIGRVPLLKMIFSLLGLEHVPIVFDCASVKAVSNRFIFQLGMHKRA